MLSKQTIPSVQLELECHFCGHGVEQRSAPRQVDGRSQRLLEEPDQRDHLSIVRPHTLKDQNREKLEFRHER